MAEVPNQCPKEQWKKEEPCGGIEIFPYAVCCRCPVPIPVEGRSTFPNPIVLNMRGSYEDKLAALLAQRVVVYPRTKFTFPFFGRVVGTSK